MARRRAFSSIFTRKVAPRRAYKPSQYPKVTRIVGKPGTNIDEHALLGATFLVKARRCAGPTVALSHYFLDLLDPCEVYGMAMPPWRKEVKEFEVITTSIAKRLGESKSSIETDEN